MYLFVGVFVCLSMCVCLCLCMCVCVCLSLYVSVCLSECLCLSAMVFISGVCEKVLFLNFNVCVSVSVCELCELCDDQLFKMRVENVTIQNLHSVLWGSFE